MEQTAPPSVQPSREQEPVLQDGWVTIQHCWVYWTTVTTRSTTLYLVTGTVVQTGVVTVVLLHSLTGTVLTSTSLTVV